MPHTITLTGDSLTLADLVVVARQGAQVRIAPDAAARADRSRAAIQRLVERGAAVYGVNTGFGRLASERIPSDNIRQLQRNLILSHASGMGDPLPPDVVRGMMLLRANVLLRPTSGVRPLLAERLAAMLNAAIHPVVPEQGSVGASGDLAPLSHMAMALIGEGDVDVGPPIIGGDAKPVRLPAGQALRDAGLDPIELEAKEGLAFINGTQAQSAILALVAHDARNLWRTAHAAAAMSIEALLGTPVPFEQRIHDVRPHRGQHRSAELLRELIEGSEIRESHRTHDPRVQDAYSLRCAPQILGAVCDAIEFAAGVVEVELNAATDNPLVFGDEIVSGGNFHGQPVALALDVLAIALTTLAGVAERRIERMVNPDLSQGLPPFLTSNAGLQSGLMMVQITAASQVAECRVLATPASVQSIPTDANQEDFVPMSMVAAYKAQRILRNAQRVVAAELITAAQGLEFRKPLRPGRAVEEVYCRVREMVSPLTDDRSLTPDLERVTALVAQEALI
jgi:histidine ammonia-lyase